MKIISTGGDWVNIDNGDEWITFSHWDGSSWTAEHNPASSKILYSHWGSSANDIWAIGKGIIIRY